MLQQGLAGHSALLISPTGGGKTLAGFLSTLHELAEPHSHEGIHTLYISPLKALAVDIARNLEAPVREMDLPITIETRTGDTPQSRPRVFVIAEDKRVAIPAVLTGSQPNWLHSGAVRKVSEGLSDWVWWNVPEPVASPLSLDDVIEWDAPFHAPDSEARTLSLISPKHRERLDAMGDNVRFVAPGYKRTRNGKQVLELRFDGLSGCLRTPEGGSSRQVIVIKQNGVLRSRLLTVREAARLMGAPDTYRIPGTYNDGYKAMGDAVAAPVAGWLAQHLLKPLAAQVSRGCPGGDD